jgi:hypothetical protein
MSNPANYLGADMGTVDALYSIQSQCRYIILDHSPRTTDVGRSTYQLFKDAVKIECFEYRNLKNPRFQSELDLISYWILDFIIDIDKNGCSEMLPSPKLVVDMLLIDDDLLSYCRKQIVYDEVTSYPEREPCIINISYLKICLDMYEKNKNNLTMDDHKNVKY